MAAPGGLEQWQKDGFFQAAEEVQESTDLMESIYRTWMRERTNSSSLEEVNDLQRELQTALGTAKWQLEQFERAVGSSNDKYSLEEGTIARRRQFVVAIEDQISRVEKALSGSLMDNGRQGLNWVKLDDEERDDLVAFLSAPAQFYSEVMSSNNSVHVPSRQTNLPICMNDQRDMAMVIKDIHEVPPREISSVKSVHVPSRQTNLPICMNDQRDMAMVIKDIHEVPPREISSVKSDVCGLSEQLHNHRTNLSSGDDHWKIDIGNDELDSGKNLSPNRVETSRQTLLGTRKSTESLTRVRWFWNSMWKPKSDEHCPSTYDMSNHLNFRSIYLLAQKFNGLTDRSRSYLSSWKDNSRTSGRMGGLHIQGQQQSIQFGRSIRITLLLMLSIFLIVPFLVSST